MTDEAKALVERLRGDWPEIIVEKHWMMDSDAIDKQREEAADRIEALSAENERLREAGKDLGFYAGHDDSCDCVKGWAKGPCNCGYTETWKQWTAALGDTK